MKNGLPFVYGTYRALWTTLHLILVAAGVVALVVWFGHNGQGVSVITGTWTQLSYAQATVANAIRFPWGG